MKCRPTKSLGVNKGFVSFFLPPGKRRKGKVGNPASSIFFFACLLDCSWGLVQLVDVPIFRQLLESTVPQLIVMLFLILGHFGKDCSFLNLPSLIYKPFKPASILIINAPYAHSYNL